MPKLRWDCNRGGPGCNCFNRVKRPKIEVFDDCFSRGAAFGDVDAVVDNGGALLFLEWKEPGAPVSRGQQILHKRLTAASEKITVVVVFGDAETMAVEALQFVHKGEFHPMERATLDDVKRRLRAWWRRGLATEGERNAFDLSRRQPGDDLADLGRALRSTRPTSLPQP